MEVYTEMITINQNFMHECFARQLGYKFILLVLYEMYLHTQKFILFVFHEQGPMSVWHPQWIVRHIHSLLIAMLQKCLCNKSRTRTSKQKMLAYAISISKPFCWYLQIVAASNISALPYSCLCILPFSAHVLYKKPVKDIHTPSHCNSLL